MRQGYRALGLCAEGRVEEAYVLVKGPHRAAEGLSFVMMAEARVLHALGRPEELLAHCAAASRLPLAEALLGLDRPSVAAEALARAEAPLRRAGARAELARFTTLSVQAGSGPDHGQRGGGDEHAGEAAVDETGAAGVAE
jgi:hypothetical protein